MLYIFYNINSITIGGYEPYMWEVLPSTFLTQATPGSKNHMHAHT